MQILSNIEKEKFFIDLINRGLLFLEGTRIFNTKTKRHIGYIDSTGYWKISYMCPDSKTIYKMSVSRLIWLVSNGEIPNDMVINHIDGVKTNNELSNLEVVSMKQNALHAFENGLLKLPDLKRYEAWNRYIDRRKVNAEVNRLNFEKNCKRPSALGSGNSQFGSYWITDGEKKIKWHDRKGNLPEGFKLHIGPYTKRDRSSVG